MADAVLVRGFCGVCFPVGRFSWRLLRFPQSVAVEKATARLNLFLGLQPQFDQAADCFGAAGKVVLLAAPIIELLGHLGLNADANKITRDRRPLFAVFMIT
jgi:hypothetical protein